MKAYYHLPGLFEFYELYKIFFRLFREHREYFYDWCDIGSVYGAPADCLWGGGRVGFGESRQEEVFALMRENGISARLTFSNSLLREEHLADRKCNQLCRMAAENGAVPAGVIVASDLLTEYLRENYPELYLVSSTTKVQTGWEELEAELDRPEFRYVVPDFRQNVKIEAFRGLTQSQKEKVELLCNECCSFTCPDRKKCYEDVSRKSLGEDGPEHRCTSLTADRGYRFSDAMENPGFIGIDGIRDTWLPMGISNFKIEGRSLGSAIVLEFLLYYMTKPECRLKVREEVYLDSSLDLF
jgi:collagenase-like PrtC family protease